MLRPRYSLLAFLLFTAAVAGGVKLWRGPHHVVDRSNPQMEDEYTYYRDWDGTKIVDGVRVLRYFSNAKLLIVRIHYYREGIRAPKEIVFRPESPPAKLSHRIIGPFPYLNESEQERYLEVLRRELATLESQGMVAVRSDGIE